MSLMNLAGETLCCVCHRVVDPHKAISDGNETPDEEFVAAEVIAHVTDIPEVGYCSMRYYHADCYRAGSDGASRGGAAMSVHSDTKEEQEQLKEAKQLARQQGLSMTASRGAGGYYHLRDKTFDYHFSGYLHAVLRELRNRKAEEKEVQP